MDNEVVQTDSRRKFARFTRKPTEQFERHRTKLGWWHSDSCGWTRAGAVAESATTHSTTSSMIRVVETEDLSNTECHKVLAGTSHRHETIADMDTCGAIDMMTDCQGCDGWTQQVVDRNKKCCGTKSGHLGHLFESQKVSERRIKSLRTSIAQQEKSSTPGGWTMWQKKRRKILLQTGAVRTRHRSMRLTMRKECRRQHQSC